MKKLLYSSTIFPLFILSSFVYGQNPAWIAKYNNANARAMTIDADGNIYVTGPGDGGKKAGLDFVVVKYTPDGGLAWSARYNGPNSGEDWPYAIAVDSNGNVYVTGRSFTSNNPGGMYNFDYATVKYNSDGGLVWAKRFGSAGNRNDVPQDVKVDDNGGVYVTGYSDAQLVLGAGNAIVTIKYNSSGDTLWKRTYDALPNSYESTNPNKEEAYSLALDEGGNVYVAGTVIVKYSNSGDSVWVKSENLDRRKILIDASGSIVVTGFSGITTKYNGSGDLIWQTPYPNAGLWDMVLDQTGNVYVTGESNSSYVTAKYNAIDGSPAWSATYFGSGNSTDFARSIAVDNSGNTFVTGHTTVVSGRTNAVKMGTVKYNSAGKQQWLSLYDGDGFAIAADETDNIYAAGTSAATRTNPGGIALLKFAPGDAASKSAYSFSSFENRTAAIFGLHNYPNPFYRNTTIEFRLPTDAKVRVSVIDLLGKEVATLVNENKPAGVHTVEFKAGKFPAGVYFYRVQADEFSETKKLIILK